MEGNNVRGIHRDKSTGKKNNRNKRHMGKDGDKGVAQGKGAGAHKFTGIIEIQWKWTLS